MNKFKLLVIGFLTVILGSTVAVGAALNNEAHSVEAEAATEGSMTNLYINDTLGWNFRAICLSGFKYADGYSKTDLDAFIKEHYKTQASSDSAIKESSAKSYRIGDSYVYINSGGTSKTRNNHIPGWVLDYKIELCNNGNTWSPGKLSGTYVHSQGTTDKGQGTNANGCGKTVELKTGKHWDVNNSLYCGVSNTTNYFDKLVVTKKYMSGSTSVKTDTTESKYQYYRYDAGAVPAIDKYISTGKWYKDSSFNTTYTNNSILYDNLTLYASYSSIAYEVNEYYVFDGVVDDEPFSTTSQNPSYSPVQENKDGYLSKGIYTDSGCENEYSGTLTADTNLYHLYEKEEYGYIYISSFGNDWYGDPEDKSATEFRLYLWNSASGKELNGTWPGNTLDIGEYSSIGLNFNKNGGLIRIPVLLNGNEVADRFIINSTKNNSTQTADLVLSIDSYYHIDKLFSGATAGFEGDATLGEQAALAFDLEEAFINAGSYTYDGKEFAQSVCAIEKEDATELVGRYYDLSSNTAFNKTTFWTNDHTGEKQNADYTGVELINALSTRYKLGTPDELNVLLIAKGSDSIDIVVIIAVISVVTLGAAFVVIKKRKQTSK